MLFFTQNILCILSDDYPFQSQIVVDFSKPLKAYF